MIRGRGLGSDGVSARQIRAAGGSLIQNRAGLSAVRITARRHRNGHAAGGTAIRAAVRSGSGSLPGARRSARAARFATARPGPGTTGKRQRLRIARRAPAECACPPSGPGADPDDTAPGPAPQDLDQVRDAFGLHELAVEDARTFHLRPKADRYEGDVQLVICGPRDTTTRPSGPSSARSASSSRRPSALPCGKEWPASCARRGSGWSSGLSCSSRGDLVGAAAGCACAVAQAPRSRRRHRHDRELGNGETGRQNGQGLTVSTGRPGRAFFGYVTDTDE